MHEILLHHRLEEGEQKPPPAAIDRQLPFARVFPKHRGIHRGAFIDAQCRSNRGGHRAPGEHLAEVDFLLVVDELSISAKRGQHVANQLLGQVHRVAVVGERLVELDGGELRAVAPRQPFVAEAAVDFVDPLEAANDQPLQVQLRRHAQVQVHAQAVVVGDERPRRRAARNGVHHRRFHFQIVARVEEAANGGDGARANAERLPGCRVGGQIEIALAVARLPIAQAVVLLRQRMQRFGQQPRCVRAHRELALVGLHQRAGYADDVAQIPHGKDVVVDGRAQVVPAQVALNASAHVLQGQEARLAHDATQHQPASHPHFEMRRFKLRLAGRVVDVGETGREIAAPEVVRIRFAAFAQGRELALAVRRQVVALGVHRPAFRFASMNSSKSPSSTLPGSCRSMSVRRSFTRDWSST